MTKNDDQRRQRLLKDAKTMGVKVPRGAFLAITPATLAARCNGPVFTSRRPAPVYARTAVFA